MKMQWTDEQWKEAQRLQDAGQNYSQIAAALGMTWRQVKNRFYHKSLSRARLDERNAMEREHRLYRRDPAVRPTYKPPYAWPEPSPDAVAERNTRLATRPRDLTAALLGDPRPGWSALERRA